MIKKFQTLAGLDERRNTELEKHRRSKKLDEN